MKRETLIKNIESDQIQNVQSKFNKFKIIAGGFKRRCSTCRKRK